MKRSLKLALIPTAIAAALSANQAFAGSEACFEVYSAADGAPVTAHATLYNAAQCVAPNLRAAAGAADLEPIDSTSIAYELTGDYDADLEDIDGAAGDLHVVYIPTTDLPSGTVVRISLSGATWANNANQLHLVQDNAGTYELVASSDGAFDGTSTVTFLTKAGVTIGAGTRLAFTTNNAIDGQAAPANSALIESPEFNISNTACPTSGAVSISAISAVTDGGNGFAIAGGVTSAATEIADISPQFVMFDGPTAGFVEGSATLVVEQVDAEDTNGTPRTIFVDDGLNPGSNDFVVAGNSAVVYPFVMIDRAPLLDQAVTLGAGDELNLAVVASADPGATVVTNLYDTWAANGQDTDLIPTNAVDLNGATAGTAIAPSIAGGTITSVALPATAVFADNSNDAGSYFTEDGTVNDNGWYLTLENSDPTGVMNFNYTVDAQYSLTFASASLIDHCETTEGAFQIGVNGAVLKVPYTYDANTNWVRITNEHSEQALVSLDVFDESGNMINAVEVGALGAKSSKVYLANELLDMAAAAGYTGTGTRHTMTFTVTAPSDSVHGVSVQKIPGGVDRVLPVLDQNVWQQ